MPLYTDEELKQLPEFDNLDEALRDPGKVLRFQAYRQGDADILSRVLELKKLQSLSISLSNVSKLLPGMADLPDLQNVYLQACDIRAFPESVLELHALRSLSIGNNSLEELPSEITGLKKLESLYLSQNKLCQIPDNIGDLIQLNTLGLSYNQIEELPESIGNLDQLEWLFLDVNHLKQLPQVIGNLRKLQNLTLNCNRLRTLPESICKLAQLRSLDLERNPFESLPSALSGMSGLERLSIEAGKRALFMNWNYDPSAKPARMEVSSLKLFVTPDSEVFPLLKRMIFDAGLAGVEEIIIRTAREAIEIESTVPDDYSQLGVSRLGGFPDLERPETFPKTDGQHWIFLAQLDLAELAPFNSYLPRSGLLSFFLDSTERLNGKVLFSEGKPDELHTVRHNGAEDMLSPDDDYSQKPHRVRFKRIFSLPHNAPNGIETDEAFEQYENSEPLHETTSHQINGYTFTQHESPQELAANEFRGQSSEWVPLLQLGWDSDVGFCFWDAGTVTFCIHQEDLRRADFSRIHVSLESS
ncbi:DUF1963 domain-containing protein [Prosthecobacter sp.]|uniref:DUF1963 domain-containing protein n=1 Tax=Prosthecobacter sp. TaxID=1965333 RepID=UPI00378442AA